MIWLLFSIILPVISWLQPGLPVLHDGQDHVARIANFYVSLTEGVLIPRWAGNLNWGYGTPILMFLYPLPSYVASGIHALGFSLVDSTKLVFILAYLASSIAMYIWMKAAFGEKAAIIGALLYSFAPYRFVDLHIRGAIGEHVAFIFPPLILYFLFKKNWIAFSFSLAALILSHNAVALMFLPVIFLYALHLKSFFTFRFLLFTFFGFALSAFFWVPALLEGKFTLRYIVTSGEALTRFVPWQWFFFSLWNYGGGEQFTKALGLPQWIGIITAIVILKKDKKIRMLIVGLFVILVLSLFMMTSWSSYIWSQSSILQNFQFPWRFLSLSVFLVAVIGGISIPRLIKNRLFFISYCLFLILCTVGMWKPKGYQVRHESFYTGIYASTTDTGESSPIWSTRFMEHTPANPLEVVDGEATITPHKRTSVLHEYTLDVKKPTLMLENTLYFPGWKIYVDGVPTGIQFQNQDYRGLMLFHVNEENKHVRVIFEDTKTRNISNMVSLVAIVSLLGLYLWQKRNSLLR